MTTPDQDPSIKALGELLAVIFRDGGQRRSEIANDTVAGAEAQKIVCELRRQNDRLKELLTRAARSRHDVLHNKTYPGMPFGACENSICREVRTALATQEGYA